ncbi:MAG: hypothetical protein KKD44_05065 [Proteobacteria bacterium]|nr:hypothetical protein [Pseudomonadota bacterium]
MKTLWTRISTMVLTALLVLPAVVFASGEKAAAVVIVSDTRKLEGILRWWGDLYNESHLQFSLLTILLIPLIGLLFGIIADLVMRTIGIDLGSRELSEH